MRINNISISLFPLYSTIIPIFLFVGFILGGCTDQKGANEAEILTLTAENGATAQLQGLSYQDTGFLSCTISITIPEGAVSQQDTGQTHLDVCSTTYLPSISYQDAEYPLVVMGRQIREEDDSPVVYQMETETWLTQNPPEPESWVEIHITGFDTPFRAVLNRTEDSTIHST